MKIRPVFNYFKLLSVSSFLVQKKKKIMVGSIHPFGANVDYIPDYPLGDLLWIVWDRYRGKPEAPLVDHCCVCKYVTEFALDALWSKWNHEKYLPFAVFVNNLINTDMYDFHMGKVSSRQMKTLIFFCLGISPDPREKTFIDDKFVLRIRGFNI